MSILQLMNEEITAPEQVAFIQEAITQREAELELLTKNFETEKTKLQSIRNTVDILTHQHSYLLQLLEIHKRELDAHERALSDVIDLKSTTKAQGKIPESDFLVELALFPNQSSQKKDKISKISTKLDEIRQDLHSKLYVEPIQKFHVDAMEGYLNNVRTTLGELKAAFGPIRRVPAEVWSLIFRYRIAADVQEYIESPGIDFYHSSTVMLSHVSHFWRNIVRTNRDFWQYFICGPEQMWKTRQVERWNIFSSFNSPNKVLISNLQSPTNSFGNIGHMQEGMVSGPPSIHLLCNNSDKTLEAVKRIPFRGQSSLTLQMHEPASKAFLDSLVLCFPAFSSLKIVQSQPLPNLQPFIYSRRDPAVERLTLDLGSFIPFRLDYYCQETFLKEIQFIHNGTDSIIGRPGPGTMSCPLLEVVGITPPDVAWMNQYSLTALRQLILYGPKLHSIEAPSLIELSNHPYFRNARELELRNWPVYNPASTPSWSVAPLVLAIVDKLRSVEIIRCIDSVIEGECFVALVRLLKENKKGKGPSKLSTVVIDCCTGITRDHCELIAESVEKLIVHV